MRGFTFLEVIMVVAIMLLVGVISTWFATNFFFERQTVLVSQLVRSSLVRAGTYAINGKSDSDWGVTHVGGSIVIFSGSRYAERDVTQDELIPFSSSVTITGLGEVIFARPTGTTTPTTIDIVGHDSTIHFSINREGAITDL